MVLDALAGVRDTWRAEGSEGLGVRDLLSDASLRERVDVLLDTAEMRLGEIPESLEVTIAIEPEIVSRAQESLLALQLILQVEVAQALDVTITFNDNDGD